MQSIFRFTDLIHFLPVLLLCPLLFRPLFFLSSFLVFLSFLSFHSFLLLLSLPLFFLVQSSHISAVCASLSPTFLPCLFLSPSTFGNLLYLIGFLFFLIYSSSCFASSTFDIFPLYLLS